ncbi:MAG: type IV pilus secretin PilQ [Deltaproteobacteria bacterium]|nr:type IV pilus secretin PilQ [Deltaproteobacteria bacterium]
MKLRTKPWTLLSIMLAGWLLLAPGQLLALGDQAAGNQPAAGNPSPAAASLQVITPRAEREGKTVKVIFQGEREMLKHQTFHLFRVDNPPRLGIDFPEAKLAGGDLNRFLGGTGFSGFRYQNYPDKTRVVFDTDLDQLPPYSYTANGNQLVLSFPCSTAASSQQAAPAAAPAPPKTSVAAAPRKIRRRPVRRSTRITVDFKDADLQNVFRFLADIKNYNLIMGDEVQGKVTLKLKNVPWQQAFRILLKTNKLGMEREGNVIRIAPLSRFKEEREALAMNKKAQETLEDTVIEILNVNFAKAQEIAPRLRAILSDRGSIDIDERTNVLIIDDIPKRIRAAKKLLAKLDTPIKQVLIEAKIVKIETNAVKDIGIQWGGAWGDNNGSHYYGVNGAVGDTGGPGITPQPGAPTIASNYVINMPAAGATSGIGLIFGKVGVFNLNLKLTALKNKHLAKILSTPKILALDNHKARIGQGTEIPYATTSDAGTTTEFKKAELSLEVTPHITNNDHVAMNVKINKDSPGMFTQDGPAINTQSIETMLLLDNGETAVVGGIIEKNDTNDNDEVPGFSSVPLFGDLLFKHKFKKREQTELLIFITPSVIPTQTTMKF